MVSRHQVQEAEAKQAKLLGRMQEIDVLLGTLTPNDPERRKLVAEKNEILPRYRGAKSHAKNLRRAFNSLPDSERNSDPDRELQEVVDDVDREEMFGKAYLLLASLHKRMQEDSSRVDHAESLGLYRVMKIRVESEEIDLIEDFLDWWEHTHEPVESRK